MYVKVSVLDIEDESIVKRMSDSWWCWRESYGTKSQWGSSSADYECMYQNFMELDLIVDIFHRKS